MFQKNSMEEDRTQDDKDNIIIAVRKLRKKLRQIESLEKVARPLTAEEIYKVNNNLLQSIAYYTYFQ